MLDPLKGLSSPAYVSVGLGFIESSPPSMPSCTKVEFDGASVTDAKVSICTCTPSALFSLSDTEGTPRLRRLRNAREVEVVLKMKGSR